MSDTSLQTTSKWSPEKPHASTRLRVESLIQREDQRVKAVSSALAMKKDDSVKQIAEHSINVASLNSTERMALLEGPKISVIGDGNIVIRKGIPLRALVASCTKAHDLLHVKPSVTQFRVYSKLDRESIEQILDQFTTKQGLGSGNFKLTSDNLVKDILMYQACLALGVVYHHTKALLDNLRTEISANLLTKQEMNVITSRIRASDPLFKHLANELCHRRIKERIPDIIAFEKWLRNQKSLQAAMMVIDQGHKSRRSMINQNKLKWKFGHNSNSENKDEVEANQGEDDTAAT